MLDFPQSRDILIFRNFFPYKMAFNLTLIGVNTVNTIFFLVIALWIENFGWGLGSFVLLLLSLVAST